MIYLLLSLEFTPCLCFFAGAPWSTCSFSSSLRCILPLDFYPSYLAIARLQRSIITIPLPLIALYGGLFAYLLFFWSFLFFAFPCLLRSSLLYALYLIYLSSLPSRPWHSLPVAVLIIIITAYRVNERSIERKKRKHFASLPLIYLAYLPTLLPCSLFLCMM